MTTAHHVADRPGGSEPGAPAGGDTVGAATSLLDAYEPGRARFFASPTRTLLAHGVRAEVPHGTAPVARRVAETLAARVRAADDDRGRVS
ncbi:hypothetical protein ABZY03_16220, partial [Streptomyces klenkii]